MSRPTDSIWRIVMKDGLTKVVDSDTLGWLCRNDSMPRSIVLLRGREAEDAREARDNA